MILKKLEQLQKKPIIKYTNYEMLRLDLPGHLQESVKYVCKTLFKEGKGGGLSGAESGTLLGIVNTR